MDDGIEQECENCERFEKEIAELKAQVKKLTELVEKSQRSGKRQAAPFRKTKKRNPKKLGRKPGDDYGTQAFRKAPSP